MFMFPNVYEVGVYALLASKQFMDKFLEKENLELIWTVLGEKQVFKQNNNVNYKTFNKIIKF